MKALIFDLETTGIPCDRKATFRNMDVYDKVRIVSIAWRLMDVDSEEELRSRYYVIKPVGYEIPQGSINIHGITTERALEEGISLQTAIDELMPDIDECTVLVAHNIMFDVTILRSELCRLGMEPAIDTTFQKKLFCTMRESQKRKLVTKLPKLTDLFVLLFPDEAADCTNAHNAYYDVQYCWRIYAHMHKAEQQQLSEDGRHRLPAEELCA
jgi:DNA polymerase III epsilon subunit-like protein